MFKLLLEITSDPTSHVLLNEANLYNAKQPYNDVSLVGWLKEIAKNIGDQQLAAQFVNKLSKILINDDKYHVAVRELPADAPDWAREALARRELVAFEPTPALTDVANNIMHYLVAALQASKNKENKDEAVVASKELAGFPKSGSIEELQKKANEYFKRGSKKAVGEITGMKLIGKDPDGFEWYKLEDSHAFRREGKVLQNCIGSHYTPESCRRDGYSIVVMKSGNTKESHVALRITNGSNEVNEVKGKNNKPPIPKYMPAVARFMTKHKIVPTSGGQHDLTNAGYYFIEGEIVDKATAIKKFIHTKPIGKTENGTTVEHVDYKPGTETLVADVYMPAQHSWSSSNVSKLKGKTIYQLTKGSQIAYAIVDDSKTVTMLKTINVKHKRNLGEAAGQGNPAIVDLIRFLSDEDKIERISLDINRDMFWSDRVIINNKGEITKVEGTKEKHHDKAHEVEHFNHPDVQAIINHTATEKSHEPTDHNKSDKKQYIAKLDDGGTGGNPKSRNLIISRDADGKLNPVHHVEGANRWDIEHPGTLKKDDGSSTRDHKTVQTVISVANKHGDDINSKFKWLHGIVTDTDGKHHVVKPHGDVVMSDPHVVHYDLSEYDEESLPTVIHAITNDAGARKIGHTGDKLSRESRTDVGLSSFRTGPQHSDVAVDKSLDIHRQNNEMIPNFMFGKHGSANNIYFVDVKYAKGNEDHRIALVAKGKKVISIDDSTLTHNFKHWSDHDKVADQVQKAADKLNLTFDRSVANANKSDELRVNKGRLTTAAAVADDKLSKMKDSGMLEDADREIILSSGHKITPMNNEDTVSYLRKNLHISSVPGQAWEVTDKDGHNEFVFFTKKNKVVAVYGHDISYGKGKSPTGVAGELKGAKPTKHMGIGTYEKKIMKPVMDKMGLTYDAKMEGRNEKLGKNNERERILHNGSMDRFRAVMAGTYNVEKDSHHHKIRMRHFKQFEDMGLVKLKRDENGNLQQYKLTRKGFEAANNIADADTDWHKIKSDTEDSKPKPEPKAAGDAAPARPARAAGAPRTGTKASMALDRFRELTTANDAMPTRKEFMEILMAAPFNMSKAAASTYHANTKKKYSQLDEKYSVLAALEMMLEEANEYHKPSTLTSFLLFGDR